MSTFFEVYEDGVREAPVAPFFHTALGQHYGTQQFGTAPQGAEGAFVVRVNGAVAVGVAEINGVEAGFGYRDGDGKGGVAGGRDFDEALTSEAFVSQRGFGGHGFELHLSGDSGSFGPGFEGFAGEGFAPGIIYGNNLVGGEKTSGHIKTGGDRGGEQDAVFQHFVDFRAFD